jgi:3-hydroxy acid dehydrogenase/malonic semialdehyde reductase
MIAKKLNGGKMNIFITGATSGFGAAMAKHFAHDGHKVIATGRRMERLLDLKKEHPNNILALQMDVSNRVQVESVINELHDEWRHIDVLINNAGLAVGSNLAQNSSLDDWKRMVDTNINGVLYCTHAILPGMIERNKGHIINIGSVAGEFPYAGGNVYGATKAFIHQFSLNLRSDLLGKNIRVTNVEPGMCKTEFSEVRFGGDMNKAEAVYSGMTPLNAIDIAETIAWIITRPEHVNINVISLMPNQQAFAGFSVDRSKNR